MFKNTSNAHRRTAHLSTSRHPSGQGMMEYLLIMSLVGIASFGVFRMFGESIKSKVEKAKMKINQEIKIELKDEN